MMQPTYEMFLDGTIAERENGTIPNDHIVDSHFVELMARPGDDPALTYDLLELDWPAGHDRTITGYLA